MCSLLDIHEELCTLFTMGNHAPITVVERSPHCGRQSSEMERTRGLDFFELLNQSP